MLSNSAGYLIALKRFAEARDYAAEAVRSSRAIGMMHGGLWSMQHLAAAAVLGNANADRESAFRRAASILGFIDDASSRRGLPRYSNEQGEYESVLAILREAFGHDELSRLISAGKSWSEDQAVAEALAL